MAFRRDVFKFITITTDTVNRTCHLCKWSMQYYKIIIYNTYYAGGTVDYYNINTLML